MFFPSPHVLPITPCSSHHPMFFQPPHVLPITPMHFLPITPCSSHHPMFFPSPHVLPITPCSSHHPMFFPSLHVPPITPCSSHHPMFFPLIHSSSCSAYQPSSWFQEADSFLQTRARHLEPFDPSKSPTLLICFILSAKNSKRPGSG
ncbi:hypothetical protein RRG08_024109 [Elysia crispata]|uniref:Uncharacterized protein n=1 Tax=Elysia crispata TaxID=231223 RepID=A0AAE1BBM5_9GAST|nr:hypothetical protein RRG08_024109 [Elysia crispata]